MPYRAASFMLEVRNLAMQGEQFSYFQGLVSRSLGKERRLDQDGDLLDLIGQSEQLQQILRELFDTPLGRARVEKAIAAIGDDPDLSVQDVSHLVWELAVGDPRFDLVIKQAIEDAKAPPQIVRGSALSRISGMVDKLRSALTSGAARHSNAVLAGSVAAGLLAGSAATKVIPSVINTGSSASPRIDSIAIVSAINALTAQIKQQNALESQIVFKSQQTVTAGSKSSLPQDSNETLLREFSGLTKRVDVLQQENDVSARLLTSLDKFDKMTTNHLNPLLDTVKLRAKDFDWKNHILCPSFDCRLISNFDQDLKNIAYDLGPYREFSDVKSSNNTDPIGKPSSHDVVSAIDALTSRTTELGTLAATMSTGSKVRGLYSFSSVGEPRKHTVFATLGQKKCTFDLTVVDAKPDGVNFNVTNVNNKTCPSNMLGLDGSVLRQRLNSPTTLLRQVTSNGQAIDFINLELVSLQRAHISQALTRADVVVDSEEVELPHSESKVSSP